MVGGALLELIRGGVDRSHGDVLVEEEERGEEDGGDNGEETEGRRQLAKGKEAGEDSSS